MYLVDVGLFGRERKVGGDLGADMTQQIWRDERRDYPVTVASIVLAESPEPITETYGWDEE